MGDEERILKRFMAALVAAVAIVLSAGVALAYGLWRWLA